MWEVLQNGAGARVMPFWAPYCAASLQILLSLGKTGNEGGGKETTALGILRDVIHMGYIYVYIICIHICIHIYISTWGYYQIPELSCGYRMKGGDRSKDAEMM